MRKNAARQIALMSGGEYAPLPTERGFETRVQEVAKHARNRYLLRLSAIRTTLRACTFWMFDFTRDLGARVVAAPATGPWKKQAGSVKCAVLLLKE